jgi:heme exporter protein B
VPAFVAVMVLASVGLSAAITLVSALLAQAKTHGALVSALAFPLIVPVLMAAVTGTKRALVEPGAAVTELRILAAYAGILVALGILLAEFVMED